MNHFFKLFSGLVIATLSQVAMSQTPPSCSDKRTQKLVVQEIRDRVVPGNHYRSIDLRVYTSHIKLDRPTPTSFQKDIKKFNCTAVIVVDAMHGGDQYGKAIMTNPQALYDAGSSVAELERFMERGMTITNEMRTYSIQIAYSSMIIDGAQQVVVSPVHQIPALLIGSFIAAYASSESNE